MESGASPTLTFRGALDLECVREVAGILSSLVGDVAREAVIDLREVTFMDSTALGALLRAAQQMRNQGRRMHLMVRPGPVTQLLEITGVTDRFELLMAPPAAEPA